MASSRRKYYSSLGEAEKVPPQESMSCGLSKSIILINFYVRPPLFQKDFLDNSSRGSFTNKQTEDAWALLDLISENTSNWDLDKDNIITIDYGYYCVKNFMLLMSLSN
jgi:hypothetical protein